MRPNFTKCAVLAASVFLILASGFMLQAEASVKVDAPPRVEKLWRKAVKECLKGKIDLSLDAKGARDWVSCSKEVSEKLLSLGEQLRFTEIKDTDSGSASATAYNTP